MIRVITKDNINECLPKVAKGLQRAITKTPLGVSWDLSSLVSEALKGEVYIFHQEDSGYSGVFYFGYTPLSKTLNFFWSGKDENNHTPVDYEEVDLFLTHIAKKTGCSSISCEGRRGGKKVLTPLGYTEDSVVYTKEVAHEF